MNMATRSINMAIGCEECTHANAYGQDCDYGLMFPPLVFMGGFDKCPNFKPKTTEQLEEQLKNENNESKQTL